MIGRHRFPLWDMLDQAEVTHLLAPELSQTWDGGATLRADIHQTILGERGQHRAAHVRRSP
ncbi:hypothetical protein AYJ54_38080 [Bradyrhizobium centrolobii]|uniref:Uncharacterized protein n=1 Tax=Bradyrhizobium centrolobii TaxID=1505087 RepID=A0A176Z9E5_9BRAD|nr:hypothetical protein AYJ54_38080 [Bradyrhizobium centrolobii]